MPPSSNQQLSHDKRHYPHPHRGPLVLPNTPFLYQILRHAHIGGRLALRDVNLDVEKTYAEIVSDTVHLRNALWERLPPEALAELDKGDGETFIGVLAPGGYEYIVAVLAIMALGAVVVPMSVAVPVEEASYFVIKSQQAAILTSQGASKLGSLIASHVNKIGKSTSKTASTSLESIPILPNLKSKANIPPSSIHISTGLYLSDNAAGIVIFTSGTSGPPKGCVIRRGYITDASRAIADHFALSSSDTSLHLLPVHHISGLAINILPFLLAGSCIEFRSGGFDAEWTWERWCRGALTIFSGVPTIYMRMMRWYQANLAALPEAKRTPYEEGARAFRAMLCGTSALPHPVADFWKTLRGGRAILTRYGSTEAGAVLRVPLETEDTPGSSVGVVAPGVDLKLVASEDDAEADAAAAAAEAADGGIADAERGKIKDTERGEIYVKSPELFSRYLHDATNTASAFTSDGYFKTGDIARREGPHYFIVGRASQDIIKSGGYKISALDIEREVLALPYVSEVMVCGADDLEFGQRVAAVVTLRGDQSEYSAKGNGEGKALSIDDLRDGLRKRLANYKLPTLLRVLEGDLPKTASGKVLKKSLGPELFPRGRWENDPNVQVWKSIASKM